MGLFLGEFHLGGSKNAALGELPGKGQQRQWLLRIFLTPDHKAQGQSS